jgi:hypothetical protein
VGHIQPPRENNLLTSKPILSALREKKVSQINNREHPNLTTNAAMSTSPLVAGNPKYSEQLFTLLLHMYQ